MSLLTRSLVKNQLLVRSKVCFTFSKYVFQSLYLKYSTKKPNISHWQKNISVRYAPKLVDVLKKTNLRKFTRENIYTMPNLLSAGRLLISPYLGYQIVLEQYQIAMLLLCVASVSDLLDGMIARKYKSQASKFGSFLDPLADKVLVGTLFISLTANHLIPIELTCLVIGRDFLLICAASIIRYKSLPEPKSMSKYFDASFSSVKILPTFISKVNTCCQLALVGTTLLSTFEAFYFINDHIILCLRYTTATTTILSFLSYILSKNTYKIFKQR